jgi:hypothetical protein
VERILSHGRAVASLTLAIAGGAVTNALTLSWNGNAIAERVIEVLG